MYVRSRGRARSLGFTPEQEQSILDDLDYQKRSTDEILDDQRKQAQIRTLMFAGAIAGLLYTLTRFGDLVSTIRHRRRREDEL